MSNVFTVPVFFICLRETIECSIIVSILLTFLKQTLPKDGRDADANVNKRLVRQIWYGIAAGLVITLIIGAGMIGAFYGLQKNVFAASEDLWEGILSLIASMIITAMGAALLRVSKLQDKWRVKIAKAIEAKDTKTTGSIGQRFKLFCERYAMFMLPFVTVLREGLEAVVFIGGVGVGAPASSFPLAVFCGLLGGILVGYIMYKGGNSASLQWFLIGSTCFLYLVAAGLFSKSVWLLQNREWGQIVGGDASEVGSGPGSYDIRKSVWHVNGANPETDGGWGVFNSIFGWTNSATYGSVISYNIYWLAVIIGFLVMGYSEKNGHLPFMEAKAGSAVADSANSLSETSSNSGAEYALEKGKIDSEPAARTTIKELSE